LWKLKKVEWDLDLENIETLEDIWELEEVWWYLDSRWTKPEAQRKAIQKIKEWSLEVKWKVYFWWNVEWIEKIFEEKEILWNLYLRWTKINSLWKLEKVEWDLDLENVSTLEDIWEVEEVWWYLYLKWSKPEVQIEALIRKKIWSLYVFSTLYVDENESIQIILENIEYKNWQIDLKNFKEKFWEEVSNIEDEELKEKVKLLLEKEKELYKKESAKKIVEIVKDKELSEEEKKKLIEEIDLDYRIYVKNIDRIIKN